MSSDHATHARDQLGQTGAIVLVEAGDHRLKLVQTLEETKVRRPKVYYRVELAEGILGAAARDPLTSSLATSGEGGE